MRYEISEVIKKDQVMELVFGNCSKPKDLLGRHFIMEGQVISAYPVSYTHLTLPTN